MSSQDVCKVKHESDSVFFNGRRPQKNWSRIKQNKMGGNPTDSLETQRIKVLYKIVFLSPDELIVVK